MHFVKISTYIINLAAILYIARKTEGPKDANAIEIVFSREQPLTLMGNDTTELFMALRKFGVDIPI